jgi:RNA polymerase sigma-70 factor, ECF subfamily
MDAREAAGREFAALRPRLLGIAYRLLGSAWDAEDVVEEAALRWLQADRSAIREPAAYLTTVVSRLALDQLRSARVRREAYPGPWLPEPALTADDQLGPLETVEQRDTLSLATMRLMEHLSPPERAVFVLRTAFDLPYEEIAGILDVTPGAARQLLHRAQARLAQERGRFPSDRQQHARLLASFLDATTSGDLGALSQLLADDVVAYNDGGGKVRAALQPIVGRDAVLRFIAGILERWPVESTPRLVEANGFPAALVTGGGQHQLVGILVVDGRITEIFNVRNPDKLRYVESQDRD